MSAPLSKLIYDGITYTDSYQIACKLNEFFTTMPQKIANEIPPCEDDNLDDSAEGNGSTVNDSLPLLNFSNCPVTDSEILEAISMLLPKKSEDFNGVSMFFIKKFKNLIVSPLRHIFIVHLYLLLYLFNSKLLKSYPCLNQVTDPCQTTIVPFLFFLVSPKFLKKLSVFVLQIF
jgi:hypothetical protein